MKPLKLTLNMDGWSHYTRRKADLNFRQIQQKIFTRDQYTCQFCGFQANEYQEIVNLDHHYGSNNDNLNNMVTACCFCAQCFFVNMIGQFGFGGGTLIYLPEMDQNELNAFSHVIFCAMMNETSYRDTAQTVYRNLKFRSQAIEDKYGPNTSNPNVFCQLIRESSDHVESLADKFLKDFRILPTFEKFKPQLECWAKSAANDLKTIK